MCLLGRPPLYYYPVKRLHKRFATRAKYAAEGKYDGHYTPDDDELQ